LKTKRNILICPLEWGLGHAGRMIPLARKLQKEENTIFIGTGPGHQQFLRGELKDVQFIDFGGFKPAYSRILPQYLALFFQIPFLLFHIIKEHRRLSKILKKYHIDIVISDNRFGLWNRNAKTVYITHQIRIPFPEKLRFLEWAGVYFHRFFIKKYDLCFIPDLPGEINLTGRLSHSSKIPENARYIGILSRFADIYDIAGSAGIPDHNTLILSGPEPQRSILRDKIISMQGNNTPVLVILEGRPGTYDEEKDYGKIIIFSHLPATDMKNIIQGSSWIIARAGYTSIMELVSMNCSALLVPTPGQTEQEYLASYLSGKGWFKVVRQKDLKRGYSLPPKNIVLPGDILKMSRILLDSALKELSDQ